VKADGSVRQVTPEGSPSWYEEQLARRVATLRDLAQTGQLQPHDLRLRKLAVALDEAKLNEAGLKSDVWGDLGKVREFIRVGTSSAGDASKAFRAWMASQESARRGAGMRARNFVFPQGGPRDRFGILPPRSER